MNWMCSITLFKTLLGLLLTGNLICVLLLYICGCSSSQPSEEENAMDDKKTIQLKPGPPEKSPTRMQITYANKSSKMTVNLDLNSQDVYLDMKGNQETPKTLTDEEIFDENWEDNETPKEKHSDKKKTDEKKEPQEVAQDWDKDSNPPSVDSAAVSKPAADEKTQKVLSEVRKAQELFYKKKYDEAMEMIDQSLQKQETAEGHALKGTIYYVQNNPEAAKTSWKKSLKLNPDMPNIVRMLEKVEGP